MIKTQWKRIYIDELLEQKWILREVGSGLRDKFLNEIGASSKKLNIFLELDRMAAIKELVLQKKQSLFFPKKHRKRIKNSTLYEIKLKNIDLKRKILYLKRKNYNFNRALEKIWKNIQIINIITDLYRKLSNF